MREVQKKVRRGREQEDEEEQERKEEGANLWL